MGGILTRREVVAALTGGVLGLAGWMATSRYFGRVKRTTVMDIIGNTPMIYLPKLSEATGCSIYAKAEFMNPFGSSKDRAVKQFLTQSKNQSDEIVEASSGSTAISLIHMCHILNKKLTLFLPNDLAQDKYHLLETLKANIIKVPPVSIVDNNHFCNLAQRYPSSKNAYYTDQFENLQNRAVHLATTGPEIYRQTNGEVDAFVCGAGTGGTIAGVSAYLKKRKPGVEIVLADPEGSGLFNKVKYEVMFTMQEKEGDRLKNPFDTIIEGVGLNRPTANFTSALIDDAFKVSDIEALHMAHYMLENEGLFVGGSSALNLAAAVKQSRKGKGQTIVTVICDTGARSMKKFYNPEYLQEKKIAFKPQKQYFVNDLSFVQ